MTHCYEVRCGSDGATRCYVGSLETDAKTGEDARAVLEERICHHLTPLEET